MAALEYAVSVISLPLGFIGLYQHWNDRMTQLIANDARQDVRLQRLEADVIALKQP
jgi:hypothetical protein